MVSIPRTLLLAIFERTCLPLSYDTGLCISSGQLVGAGLLPDEVGFSTLLPHFRGALLTLGWLSDSLYTER